MWVRIPILREASFLGKCACWRRNYKTISIGDVTKPVKKSNNPELVPTRFLPRDGEVPPEMRKHLKWMMQKDLLGQDLFLIGRPSPLRRSLAMQYLELTRRELEYVALSRDTTESDLKQRREIVGGTAHYIDQSAVNAAAKGRILLLEGIEKAERNVLPVLNNLLENREMHLEDGRLLIPADRYDRLLEEHGQEELDKWQLVRVSENFRVIALGLPVPKYVGNPLDPPLRSRFQARDIRHIPYKEELQLLLSLGPNLTSDTVSRVLSFAHTLLSDESAGLGLPDFPVENLPALISMMNLAPKLCDRDAVFRLYPYNLFLPEDGCQSVEETLSNFQMAPARRQQNVKLLSVSSAEIPEKAGMEVKVGSAKYGIIAPAGKNRGEASISPSGYVSTNYHDSFLGQLALTHAVKDFCIVGPRGCGKSIVLQRLAEMLGYDLEPIMLYQDMTARDLLQQRTTLANGDTVWRHSPLVTAALEGKMAVLDGIHRIHRGTLGVLHRLVHDRELQLYDGTRLVGQERYDAIREENGWSTDDMAKRGILPIKPEFRIAALAEPPVVGGSAKEQWLTAEVLSMFFFHSMRPLSQEEELGVLSALTGHPSQVLQEVLKVTQRLRQSEDASLRSVSNSLSTRQLLRVARRLGRFPDESAHGAITKACLARFLPSLPKEALEKTMADMGMHKSEAEKKGSQEDFVCSIEKGILTIGKTSAPIYSPDVRSKIPETLFYETWQNVASMEAMLQDFLLGEHLLLVGNQGVGKNKLIDRMLGLLHRPREYIQLHRDTTVQSLTLSPTVREGVIVYEDSPLVRAVRSGHVLVVDEADKAPTHVTCVLKTLVESGEMILSDGRRIVTSARFDRYDQEDKTKSSLIRMHPDFRVVVLANRPGFPFLGNDFFGAMGDLFSCHAVDNPSVESELSMLRRYGPDVPENTLRRLVRAFSELRTMADDGLIQYPYSTREVVNVVKHLQMFPDEGLGSVVRNVFDFDSYDKEVRDSLDEVLHKHGIPIHTSPFNLGLGREFPLPPRQTLGHWQIAGGREGSSVALPVTTRQLLLSSQKEVTTFRGRLDRVEARGLGFSEQQAYWKLPFHDAASVGDVCVLRDQQDRVAMDQVHVLSSSPVWLYSMGLADDEFRRLSLSHFFEDPRKTNMAARVKAVPLSGDFDGILAVHDEISGVMLLVHPDTGKVMQLDLPRVVETLTKLVAGGQGRREFMRLCSNITADNRLVRYSPGGHNIELIDLNLDNPTAHMVKLPAAIKSMHPLSESQFLLVSEGDNGDGKNNLYILRKSDKDSVLPDTLIPITQNCGIKDIRKVFPGGLNDFGLKTVLGEAMVTPNTIFVTEEMHAALALGFPDLEFSPNEILAWQKSEESLKSERKICPINTSYYSAAPYFDPSRCQVFLQKSCQLVRPVSPQALPSEYAGNNYGLSAPGGISAFLEVVDLMAGKLRYLPIPEPPESSVYSSWYRQTYPDQVMALGETSNEGLVSVDNSGCVRLWETGIANLERSLEEWRRMTGLEHQQLTIQRDIVKDLGGPKHGEVDPDNMPHVGGNTWAGGTGGRDTAGLGGYGGPYRLDSGHDVHQIPDSAKANVPEHIRKAARDMNRRAFEERLRQIQMSEHDAELYERYAAQVRKQVTALRTIINGLQAKAKDRQWLKNQTSGELDDTRLIEGITGERSIYKKRGEQDPEPGAPQEKPKRLRLLLDCSGSMYRFNGHDQRLERMMESALMVMEALEGYSEKFKYDLVGHSGEESAIPFVLNREPKNEKERLEVLKTMHAHAQFCWSGDHTLQATHTAINDLGKMVDDHDESFVVVLSDANFDRYGISPKSFAKILNRNDQVSAYAIFLGSLGDQAHRLARQLPSGKAFVCLDTKKIPEILKTIFTSTMLK